MSTNVTAGNNGRSNGTGRSITRGIKALPAEVQTGTDTPDIQMGELGYALQGTPWSMFGQQDPDVMEFYREVRLEDLHRMTQRDGHARALLNVLSWPMKAARLRFEPADAGDDENEFIKKMLTDPPHMGGMSSTFSNFMASTALAFRDGFAFHEKVIDTKIVDGKERIVLKKLAPRPSRTLVFKYDDHGGFAGVWQKVWWKGELKRVFIPPEKGLLFTINKEESPLEGESLFLPCYYHYDKKHRLYYIAHVAAMVGAVPLRVGTLPGGTPKQRALFMEALKNLALQGAVVVPGGATVDTHQNLSILGDIIKLIEHHDISMSKSVLAHFLDVGLSGKGKLGTATTTSELADLFLVALEAHLQDIAAVINAYLIPYFVDVNFDSGKYPTFGFEPFSDEQKKAIADIFSKVFSPTAQPTPEMLFELQRVMADDLGLDGIDWDTMKEAFLAEQEMKKQLAAEVSKAQMEAVKNPPPPIKVDPNTGKPPIVPGHPANPAVPAVNLDDPTPMDEMLRRAIELAERDVARGARAGAEVVLDVMGNPLVIGDQALLVGLGVDDADASVAFMVTSISGQLVTLRSVTDTTRTRTAMPAQLLRYIPTVAPPTPAPVPTAA